MNIKTPSTCLEYLASLKMEKEFVNINFSYTFPP